MIAIITKEFNSEYKRDFEYDIKLMKKIILCKTIQSQSSMSIIQSLVFYESFLWEFF